MERDAEILERAAELLDEEDWCQFVRHKMHSFPVRHSFCLRGALMQVTHGDTGGDPSIKVQRIEHEVARDLGIPRDVLPNWNDAPERTKEDVTNLLRRVAQKLRQQPDPSRGEGG